MRRVGGPRYYGFAIVASLLALLVTTQLHGLLDSGSFMVFLLGVVVSAGVGGLRPGLVATLISVAFIDFFFLSPRFSLRLVARADVVLVAVYALAAVFTSYVAEWLRAGRSKAESDAQQAAAVARLFERHMSELEQELRDVGARAPVRHATSESASTVPTASPYSPRRLPS